MFYIIILLVTVALALITVSPILMYILAFFLIVFLIYFMCKLIWYIIKMLQLDFTLTKKCSAKVNHIRRIILLIFGKRVLPTYFFEKGEKNYKVVVLTHFQNNSRWNFEKAGKFYYFEVRRFNKYIYNVYVNSGTEPEIAKDYRRETRLFRTKLYLEDESEKYEKQIILIYPKPKLLTLTETNWCYVDKNTKICNHEILYLDDLIDLMNNN